MNPILCVNGCGFYGSAETKKLCSKCYNDYLKEIITKHSGLECDETKNLINDNVFVLDQSSTSQKPCASECSTTDAIADASLNESENINKKRKRCRRCNKKVGLLGFECRCGNVFCTTHRYPEMHECDVDLKKIGRQALLKQNPMCIGEKLQHRI